MRTFLEQSEKMEENQIDQFVRRSMLKDREIWLNIMRIFGSNPKEVAKMFNVRESVISSGLGRLKKSLERIENSPPSRTMNIKRIMLHTGKSFSDG